MNAIKDIRKKMTLTQKEMGQAPGISRSMVEHCETGRKTLLNAPLLRLGQLEFLLHRIKKEKPELNR